MNNYYKIDITWDNEANVWWATSNTNDFGLTLEDESLEKLMKRVKIAVPDLLEVANKFFDNIILNYNISHEELVTIDGRI